MRKGYMGTGFILDKRGEILVLATGSDACAEHEGGIKPILQHLCAYDDAKVEKELLSAIQRGESVTYPPLHHRKAINLNERDIRYFDQTTGDPDSHVAVLLFGAKATGTALLQHPELAFSSFTDKDVVLTGAWDARSFGFCVRTAKMVKKLRRFYERLQNGECVFASTFMPINTRQPLSGLMIAVATTLPGAYREHIERAQQSWEASVRLKARSKCGELNKLSYNEDSYRNSPGYIWPVWSKGPDSEVLYAVNPSSGVDIDYYGPYTFEQLRDWILAKQKYPLRPLNHSV